MAGWVFLFSDLTHNSSLIVLQSDSDFLHFMYKGRSDAVGSVVLTGNRVSCGFEPHQRIPFFHEQETLPSLLNTGWFQEYTVA